jgi:mono/diheme cytochrome c family protein
MTRTVYLIGASVLLVSLALTQAILGEAPNPARAQETYQQAVLPVLSKNCFVCHNEKLKTAGLNLEAYRDGSVAVKQTTVWADVLNMLSSGQMPPAGMPAPSKAEISAVTGWIENLLGKVSAPAIPEGDPGRVTVRRLNREEYNNTVRDLLGVSVRPADEFPVDDSGYGFDNIGDVLTLSPLLMEKYMSTARKLSRVAVFGEELPPKPTVLALFLPKKGPEISVSGSGGIILPYSIRGAMYASYVFPVDAEYEFRVRVNNHRVINGLDYEAPKEKFLEALQDATQRNRLPRVQENAVPEGGGGGGGGRGGKGGVGPRRAPTPEELKVQEEKSRLAYPLVQMVLTLDGKQIAEDVFEGDARYKYDHPPVIVRVPIKAGEHFIRASFPVLADLDDPRRNINPDGLRRMYVDYAELAGPYSPSPEPSPSHKKIFICSDQTAACAREIVENLSQRAYRRPVTQQEVDQLTGLVSLAQRRGDSFDESVRLAVQAILMSPNFLFRVEHDPKPAAGSSAVSHRISDYELASRLSYFLWSSMPDDELFRLAKQQKLGQPEVLEAQVKRMMADSKASALVENFAGQWLGIRDLDRKPPDPGRFPTTDDELLDYMHNETNLFVTAVFHEDRSILDFIDAPFTYLNGPLARHYGIEGVNGEALRRVELTNSQRSGILTQGAILAVSSYPTRTSVVTRGKWVLENLLGTPPPPPPPNVPALKDQDIGTAASLREKMEQHRANPACAVCHLRMDPIGFGLENYDPSGAWRTHDGKFLIDASGTLPGGKSFNGAKGLEEVLKSESDLFTHNFTEKLLTYALGRGVERFDKSTVDGIVEDVAAHNYRFSTLVMDIVNSKPFLMRSAEGAK